MLYQHFFLWERVELVEIIKCSIIFSVPSKKKYKMSSQLFFCSRKCKILTQHFVLQITLFLSILLDNVIICLVSICRSGLANSFRFVLIVKFLFLSGTLRLEVIPEVLCSLPKTPLTEMKFLVRVGSKYCFIVIFFLSRKK